MTEFFTQFGIFLTIGAAVIAGGLALLGIWDKRQKERRNEVDGEEDRLINLLKQTVEGLTDRVNKQDQDIKNQSEEIKNLSKKVGELEKENNLLVKVLQGRDEQTQQFYKKAYEAIDIVHQSHSLLNNVAKSLENTGNTISKLIELSAKHADVTDHAIAKNKQNV